MSGCETICAFGDVTKGGEAHRNNTETLINSIFGEVIRKSSPTGMHTFLFIPSARTALVAMVTSSCHGNRVQAVED